MDRQIYISQCFSNNLSISTVPADQCYFHMLEALLKNDRYQIGRNNGGLEVKMPRVQVPVTSSVCPELTTIFMKVKFVC